MRRFLLMCCVLTCCLSVRVSGNTFVVTSIADNGAGTLRKAIQDAAANGTATPDTITFNIAQNIFNQRIITLLTPLPPLTSNLVVDGSTQPGEKFGITDAKICLKKNDYADEFTLFTISNASNVTIYGIYMLYGYWKWDIERGDRSHRLYAIRLTNATNVQIGAPGKGNVINGYHIGIYSTEDSRDIRIQSNYMGQGLYYTDYTQDVDEVVISVTAGIEMLNAQDVLIGGATPAAGNVIKANRAISLDSRYFTGNGFIRIENNVIGKDYDRTRILGGQDPFCPNIFIGENPNYLGNSTRPSMDYEVTILNNDIPTSMGLEGLSKKFIIKGNKFDLPAGSSPYTNRPAKLSITDCEDGEIGGATDAEINSFRQNGLTSIIAISAFQNAHVTISKNIFECNVTQATPTVIRTDKNTVPLIRVSSITATQVTGMSAPNCTIELFYDDDCSGCEGKVYVGSTTSDAAGNWSFSGTITGTVLATATNGEGTTGEFSLPETDIANVVIKNPSCGQSNGSITGLVVYNADGYMWQDRNGNIVGNTVDIGNLPAGQYIFYAKLGNTCMRFGAFYDLVENTARIADTTGKRIIHPSCGRNDGVIENMAVLFTDTTVIEWQNDRGELLKGEFNGPYLSLRNLYPGKYRLFIRNTLSGACNDSTFFYELVNTFGPAVDTNDVVITPASCGFNNGSITSIILRQLTNTPFVQWVDSLGRPVSNSIDLMNQPTGRYRLKFRDASGCDTVYTPYFFIPQSGILLDSSQLSITASGCTQNNGSIVGLIANGATGYRWINTINSNPVSSNMDLLNAAPGSYQLQASNNLGCTIQSNVYTVTTRPMAPISATGITAKMATCNQDNGFIHITAISNDATYFTFQWLLDSTTARGTGLQLNNLAPGRYQCIATDTNGCAKQIYASTVTRLPVGVIDISGLKVADDTCSRSVGSITGISLLNAGNGVQYTWYNGASQAVGQQRELRNTAAGSYHLEITDGNQCRISSSAFTVADVVKTLPPPVYNDYTVPKGAVLKMTPKVPASGTYKIYEVQVGGNALQQNTTGRFELPAMTRDAVYYIEIQQGDCLSLRVPVEVTVVDESKILVPNAFSPNDDGVNDSWGLRVIGIVQLQYFRVFNRWGQVVFETKDASRRWDGRLNGNMLPVGTYYYVLQATDYLGKPITQKGPVLIVR